MSEYDYKAHFLKWGACDVCGCQVCFFDVPHHVAPQYRGSSMHWTTEDDERVRLRGLRHAASMEESIDSVLFRDDEDHPLLQDPLRAGG